MHLLLVCSVVVALVSLCLVGFSTYRNREAIDLILYSLCVWQLSLYSYFIYFYSFDVFVPSLRNASIIAVMLSCVQYMLFVKCCGF